jgi:hypothetical protein
MRESIGGALVPVSEAIFGLVNAIPMWAVRTGVFALIALLAYWMASMRPQLPEGDTGKGWSLRDLRVFALVVLVIQAALYIIF